MRLFVALDPSPSACDHLRSAMSPVVAAWPGLRWTPVEQWHLTLAFLGEVAEQRVGPLAERLARAAARSSSFPLALRGFGAFSSPRRAGVVWAGVEGDIGSLTRLAERATAAARHTGIAVDERRFRAHLTIARVRHPPLDVRELVSQFAEYAGPAWPVDELRLVRSHLGAQARHETLQAWPIG